MSDALFLDAKRAQVSRDRLPFVWSILGLLFTAMASTVWFLGTGR